jgi:hypothetical protein
VSTCAPCSPQSRHTHLSSGRHRICPLHLAVRSGSILLSPVAHLLGTCPTPPCKVEHVGMWLDHWEIQGTPCSTSSPSQEIIATQTRLHHNEFTKNPKNTVGGIGLPRTGGCVVRLKQVGTITASFDIDHSTTRVTRYIACHIVNSALYYHPTVPLGIVLRDFKCRERLHSLALTHNRRCFRRCMKKPRLTDLNEDQSVIC